MIVVVILIKLRLKWQRTRAHLVALSTDMKWKLFRHSHVEGSLGETFSFLRWWRRQRNKPIHSIEKELKCISQLKGRIKCIYYADFDSSLERKSNEVNQKVSESERASKREEEEETSFAIIFCSFASWKMK